MFDRESIRKMCEYPITPSLIGEIEPVKESARERADRIWFGRHPHGPVPHVPKWPDVGPIHGSSAR
jgi:hypothetical protein